MASSSSPSFLAGRAADGTANGNEMTGVDHLEQIIGSTEQHVDSTSPQHKDEGCLLSFVENDDDDEGECSDSDALLPSTPRRSLSASVPSPISISSPSSSNKNNHQDSLNQRNSPSETTTTHHQRSPSLDGGTNAMFIMTENNEAYSPLLQGDTITSHEPVPPLPSLSSSSASSSSANRYKKRSTKDNIGGENIDGSPSSLQHPKQHKLQQKPQQSANHDHNNQAFLSPSQGGSPVQTGHPILFNHNDNGVEETHDYSIMSPPPPQNPFEQFEDTNSSFSSSGRIRSGPGSGSCSSHPSISSSATGEHAVNPNHHQTASTSTRPSSPSAASSSHVSQNNNTNDSQRETTSAAASSTTASGLGSSLRRFVLPRKSKRATATAEESSSQVSTQSLGDEDLFALSLNGEDPRLPNNASSTNAAITTSNSHAHDSSSNSNTTIHANYSLPQQQQQLLVGRSSNNSNPHQSTPQRTEWEAARMHSAENFPPIVWEETSDSELEVMERGGIRRRTLSEPSVNRLRDLFFPRQTSLSPGGGIVRRRRRGIIGRQSRSVRRHLPQSSSASGSGGSNVLSPLSTTAAAVLFTSSQSQASVGSSSRRGRQQQQLQQLYRGGTGNNGGQQPSRASSTGTGEDSLRVAGTAMDRSTIVADSIISGGAGGDAMSISTMAARSDILGMVPNDSSNTMRPTTTHNSSSAVARESQHDPQRPGVVVGADNRVDGSAANRPGTEAEAGDGSDPSRDARVRWVRINRRFQLMITFVAILFSLLLFSILISWIVMTSAFVVGFDKTCDIALKLFYWMVTLQLILDVFRGDIMRYILRWDSSNHGSTHQQIPARVVAYNIAYLAYAMLVLRLGINCVYLEGRQPESTCRITSPELFQSSVVFVTLTLAAWATIIGGYIIPFCFVACLLTWNGYNPGESVNEARVATGPGVFPNPYVNIGAPPGTIDQLREINLEESGENCPQECCICMEDFHRGDSIVQTDCGHILHKNCCGVWLRQARTCPVCRTDIPNALQERLQQQLSGQAGSPPDLEQPTEVGTRRIQRVTEAQRPRVQINSPQLPFRPGGRHEVETLIRVFRQNRTRREHRQQRTRREQRHGNHTPSGRRGGSAINSNSQRHSSIGGSSRSINSQQPNNMGGLDLVSGIEISTLRRADSSGGGSGANRGSEPNQQVL